MTFTQYGGVVSDSGPLHPSRTYAVVVGVERYDAGDDWNLNGPASDAARFTAWLMQRGVPADNISLFVSPLEPATLESILGPGTIAHPARQDRIKEVLTRTLPSLDGDLLWLFWAGHGAITREESRRLYYADASVDDKRNLDLSSLLTALRSDQFPGLPRQIVLVDACQIHVERMHYARTLPTEEFAHGLPVREREQFVLYAASPGQPAKNLDGLRAGAFSQVLMTGLAAASRDAWPPDMETLATDVEAHFRNLRATGGQIPTRFHYRTWTGAERDVRGAPTLGSLNELRHILRRTPVADPDATTWEIAARFEASDRDAFVHNVGFNPDGNLLATAASDLRLFAVGRNRLAAEPVSLEPQVSDFQFSADGRRVLAWGGSRAAVYSVPQLGEPIWEHDGHLIYDASVSPDGGLVALALGQQQSEIRDVHRKTVVQQLGPNIFEVHFSPDGTRFATRAATTGITLWDLEDQQLRRTAVPVQVPDDGDIKYLRFSASGRLLISVVKRSAGMPGNAYKVNINEPLKGTLRGWVEHANPVASIAVSEDDELLGTASLDGSAYLLPIGKATKAIKVPLPAEFIERKLGDAVYKLPRQVHGIGFGPNRSFVAFNRQEDPNVLVWQLSHDTPPEMLPHDSAVGTLAVSRQGQIATVYGQADLALGSPRRAAVVTVWTRCI